MVQYYRVKDPIENLNIRLHWKEENEDGGGGTTHKSRVIHWQEKIKPEESEALYSFYTLIDFELEVYELDDIKEAEKNRKSIKMMRIYLRCNKNDTDSKLCTTPSSSSITGRLKPGSTRSKTP